MGISISAKPDGNAVVSRRFGSKAHGRGTADIEARLLYLVSLEINCTVVKDCGGKCTLQYDTMDIQKFVLLETQ